mmetsp:Transcript_59555/g.192688  ORF Transcript_59555/g.192688 Transcript_59555/m.192688 type:complete len:244 (+) Transcript_59555:583-1314(+)
MPCRGADASVLSTAWWAARSTPPRGRWASASRSRTSSGERPSACRSRGSPGSTASGSWSRPRSTKVAFRWAVVKPFSTRPCRLATWHLCRRRPRPSMPRPATRPPRRCGRRLRRWRGVRWPCWRRSSVMWGREAAGSSSSASAICLRRPPSADPARRPRWTSVQGHTCAPGALLLAAAGGRQQAGAESARGEVLDEPGAVGLQQLRPLGRHCRAVRRQGLGLAGAGGADQIGGRLMAAWRAHV